MDERALRELELDSVARLCGIVPAAEAPLPAGQVARQASAAGAPVVGEMHWEALREAVRTCTACGLCRQRKQAVFGVGHESAPWLFIGEGPGADEDEQGEPFVGQAGKLLDGMLAAIGLARGREVYIVKCRPPGNRVPSPEEAAACAPYLDRQIELISPKLIVALGKTAVLRLLGADSSLASLRGRIHRYRDIPLVVTYHPAYLLRNLPDKAKAWEDLLFARQALRNTLGAPG
jgi:DNA polymerase